MRSPDLPSEPVFGKGSEPKLVWDLCSVVRSTVHGSRPSTTTLEPFQLARLSALDQARRSAVTKSILQ